MSCRRESVGNILQKHKYTQIKKIGEGSFGQALLVQDENGSKLVCKMIDVSQASPQETQETIKEAQLLAAFKHPFIVEYNASFRDGGWLCISMSFCEGGDLTSQVEVARNAKTWISEKQVLRWMTQALLALSYIHGKHVLHRDLKSSNFFLSKNGNLKMGDFGIAKVLSSTAAVAMTQIGTPNYLSPEVCQEKPYSWASDMWSMGCILYELCALKLPFEGSNIIQLVQRITSGSTPLIPDCYSDFSKRLCHDMLNKNPKYRPTAASILARPQFQSVVKDFFQEAEKKAAVDKGVQHESGSASSPPEPPKAEKAMAKISAGHSKGDLVEYYSGSHQRWLEAAVTEVDSEGRVRINLKPETWISKEQQIQQVRSRKPVFDACSTQALDELLGEKSASLEAPGAPVPESGGGYAEARGNLDDECSKLMEELGIIDEIPDDVDSCGRNVAQLNAGKVALQDAKNGGKKGAQLEVDTDDLSASLTQAELDLLNTGL